MARYHKDLDQEQQQIEKLVTGGAVRTALAFGVLGLLAALILTPALDNGSVNVAARSVDDLPGDIDRTVTGSITPSAAPEANRSKGTVRYTIRRSVIQSNPSEPCYIYEDGTSHGDC